MKIKKGFTLLVGTFYIQGYGADGLLPNILTVKK